MSILSDTTIRKIGLDNFVTPSDDSFINPASIDIRIGSRLLSRRKKKWVEHLLTSGNNGGYPISPHEFVLVETYETLKVPQGFAVELKLKSSIARQGFNHSLAFWFDPGWVGIGTLEIFNNLSTEFVRLEYGMRFAQIIIHELSEPATNLYSGKYQGASKVEAAK